jgi:hypothetical protein
MTQGTAQHQVDTIDQALAKLRAEVAALPAHERVDHAADIQALIAKQAHARNVLSDTLDDRRER